jgi:hypothetical protein
MAIYSKIRLINVAERVKRICNNVAKTSLKICNINFSLLIINFCL